MALFPPDPRCVRVAAPLDSPKLRRLIDATRASVGGLRRLWLEDCRLLTREQAALIGLMLTSVATEHLIINDAGPELAAILIPGILAREVDVFTADPEAVRSAVAFALSGSPKLRKPMLISLFGESREKRDVLLPVLRELWDVVNRRKPFIVVTGFIPPGMRNDAFCRKLLRLNDVTLAAQRHRPAATTAP